MWGIPIYTNKQIIPLSWMLVCQILDLCKLYFRSIFSIQWLTNTNMDGLAFIVQSDHMISYLITWLPFWSRDDMTSHIESIALHYFVQWTLKLHPNLSISLRPSIELGIRNISGLSRYLLIIFSMQFTISLHLITRWLSSSYHFSCRYFVCIFKMHCHCSYIDVMNRKCSMAVHIQNICHYFTLTSH